MTRPIYSPGSEYSERNLRQEPHHSPGWAHFLIQPVTAIYGVLHGQRVYGTITTQPK